MPPIRTTPRAAARQVMGPGIVSRILLDRRVAPDTELTVTWVELEAGARQPLHRHRQEQVYVVVEGEGRVEVDGGCTDVGAGDLVHLPGLCEHGIVNTSTKPLIYLSAATPPLEISGFYPSSEPDV